MGRRGHPKVVGVKQRDRNSGILEFKAKLAKAVEDMRGDKQWYPLAGKNGSTAANRAGVARFLSRKRLEKVFEEEDACEQ